MKYVLSVLALLVMVGCGDTIVEPTPVEIVIEDTSRDLSKYYGRWVGTWRNDDAIAWHMRIKIGALDDTGRLVMGGELKLEDKSTGYMSSFPIQGTHIVPDEYGFQVTMYVTSVWDVWCRIAPDNDDVLECSVSHVRPFGTIYTLNRENDVFPKR